MKPDRRTFLTLGTGVFLAATFPWARRRLLVRRRMPIMGTVAEFAVVSEGRRDAHAAIDAAVDELVFVDRTMSRFLADSDVGRLNAAGRAPVSAATAAVLEESLRWAHGTGGAFDPCVGRAVQLWDVQNRHAPPDGADRFAGRGLYRALELDAAAGAARLHEPDAGVDLGGIGKGYAVDRAVAALEARGITDALVNLGGDLYALGRSVDGDPWRIGVRHRSGTLTITDGAVATSGDYERFFRHRGRRYHHLLDPNTGAPHRGPRHSLTVTAPNCMAADAAATALFGMPRGAAERTLRALERDARIV